MEQQIAGYHGFGEGKNITIRPRQFAWYIPMMPVRNIFEPHRYTGHVDFYEVSRSLAACEGAILVVDASQGIEAQTLANVYLAMENDLELVPVINKIDLPSAQPDMVKKEIEDILGLEAENAPLISAKSGIGIKDVLESIVELIPPQKGDEEAPLRRHWCLIPHMTAIGELLLMSGYGGQHQGGDSIRLMASGKKFEVNDVAPSSLP